MGIRLRKPHSHRTPSPPFSPEPLKHHKKAFGRTPDGQVFEIPETHDVLSGLFDPRLPKSHIDLVTLAILGTQVSLFFVLPTHSARIFYLVTFAFFRISYNVGLGWLLRQQSETRWLVKLIVRNGYMNADRRPRTAAWCRRQLQAKLGPHYNFDNYPIEFNIWALFRHMVDIILLNDFVAYSLFAFSWLHFPHGHSVFFHVMRWLVGLTLILFNLWVKMDAHRIVTDLAWYWADCFFTSLQSLVFDGVFEMAPHPMYSIGYAGYYGLTLVTGSQIVFFVSLAAHACQFFFLVWFENPHIERTYIKKQPIAARVPLVRHNRTPSATASFAKPATPTTDHRRRGDSTSTNASTVTSTINASDLPSDETLSSATSIFSDGDEDVLSGNEDIGGPGTLPEESSSSSFQHPRNRSLSQYSELGGGSSGGGGGGPEKLVTRHDLNNRYFHGDTLICSNFDAFRAKDLFSLMLGIYSILTPFLPWHICLINALLWRVFHSFILGLALKAQSEEKWMVRHFLKHYHYPQSSNGEGAAEEAFSNWKTFYNTSLCMTYVSFCALTWQSYQVPPEWTTGTEILRHTIGILLILFHAWIARETFEVLGTFGWFYGDFFIEDYPKDLYYTGIYRFLNNPERIAGGTSFFGLALLSNSKTVTCMAVLSMLSHQWFLSAVENPHMRKLYGNAIRKEAGITKTIKNVAYKNAHRAPTELQKVYKDIQGTFEKVSTEASDAVNEFISKSAPFVTNAMHDTRILLHESREKLMITRVARDLSSFDLSQYHIQIVPPKYTDLSRDTNNVLLRFHLGDNITVRWNAPPNHSHRDWIGIYRYGSNKSHTITQVSSRGKWWGVYWDGWEGDKWIKNNSTNTNTNTTQPSPDSTPPSSSATCVNVDDEDASVPKTEGKITFSALKNKIPWETGIYEMRYHHDGKHNVMAISEPFALYVASPENVASLDEVHTSLLHIVGRCLEEDPKLVPIAYLQQSRTQQRLATVTAASSSASSTSNISGILNNNSSISSSSASSSNTSNSNSNSNNQSAISTSSTSAASSSTTSLRAEIIENRTNDDDFVLYTPEQAQHIAIAIKEAFGIELAPEVVVADANVGMLAERIVQAIRLLQPFAPIVEDDDSEN